MLNQQCVSFFYEAEASRYEVWRQSLHEGVSVRKNGVVAHLTKIGTASILPSPDFMPWNAGWLRRGNLAHRPIGKRCRIKTSSINRYTSVCGRPSADKVFVESRKPLEPGRALTPY